ncbi:MULTISPECIES: alkyl sulfatase dimerization domain-containing protein [Frankia]|uniref:Alkyl sulfatase dimerisation domain-containing protein n=1 Tax=Frankia alni (strain DSM 45986 / CECT 9034 / ACN14a) TaxID=326424 RepID=Q0REC2_FRAAA|nr:hypothetical protein FRAAL5555 [Frankia alni ACN14a]
MFGGDGSHRTGHLLSCSRRRTRPLARHPGRHDQATGRIPTHHAQAWYTHGFYGSVSHNVKGVYQRYPIVTP